MDDEDLVRDMAMGTLEHLGFRTRCARDGGEAIRMYRDAAMDGAPFHLVIMDLTGRPVRQAVPDGELPPGNGLSLSVVL